MQGFFHPADLLSQRLENRSRDELKHELLGVYRQLVPGRDRMTEWGKYSEYRGEIKKRPEMIHALLLLFLDSGLTKEKERITKRYYDGPEVKLDAPLVDSERNKLVGYVNQTCSQIAFNKRYGIRPSKE